MKLSIIVPVYNMASEGKLEFCIRSLANQTIDDYEIIDLIHKKICPNNKIVEAHNTSDGANRKKQYILQWTSRHMVETLISKYLI